MPGISEFVHDANIVGTPQWQHAVCIAAYMLMLKVWDFNARLFMLMLNVAFAMPLAGAYVKQPAMQISIFHVPHQAGV